MRTLSQRFFRRTGMLSDVARMAALAALALGLGIGGNALTPGGLTLWPTPGQRVGVPLGVWGQLKIVEADTVRPGNGLLVDVREPRDYEAGHPAGAANLPYRGFSAAFPGFRGAVKRGTGLYLYCYGSECGTSLRVANRLVQNGFTDVTIVRGGFEAWKDRDLPTSVGSAPGG